MYITKNTAIRLAAVIAIIMAMVKVRTDMTPITTIMMPPMKTTTIIPITATMHIPLHVTTIRNPIGMTRRQL